MHPGDDSDTLIVVVGGFEGSGSSLDELTVPLYTTFYGQFPGIIQTFHHFITMCVYCDNCVTSVQELCSGYEPYFILFNVFIQFIFIVIFKE